MSRAQGCNSLYFSVFEFWMSNHHINCNRKGWIKENLPVKGFLYALAVAGGWVGGLTDGSEREERTDQSLQPCVCEQNRLFLLCCRRNTIVLRYSLSAP